MNSGFRASFFAGTCAVAFLGMVQLIPVAEPAPAAPEPQEKRGGPVVLVEAVEPSMASPAPAAMIDRIRRNPSWLHREALTRYAQTVSAYTCTFWKQERIGGKLRKVEGIDIRYREEPVSVFMTWKQNPDQVRRALWVDHPDFVDRHGQKMAKIEPNGSIVRLLVSEVDLPIHGSRAKKASRAPMDQFGFRRTLELFDEDNSKAERAGVLEVAYDGVGEIDGRPTFKLVRYLPYKGEGGLYPNAKLIMHIDQQWLLPTAVYGYADRSGRELLCSYVFTDVTLNPDLTDQDFKW